MSTPIPWAALAIALVLRVTIACVGVGTNDVLLWQQFGRAAWTTSLVDLWRDDPWMNHPPLPVAFATLAYAVAGERLHLFGLLIKLPALVGDLASIVLVARIVAARVGDVHAGRVAALLFALNPASLLLAGYHGNVDPLMAMFALLTWHLAGLGRLGLAGLAAGAAIDVKLAAAPAALLLLACARSRSGLHRATAGLLIAAVPFVVMAALAGRPFLDQTLGYRPPGVSWLVALPWAYRGHDAIGPFAMWLASAHAATTIQCVLLLGVALAVRWHRDARVGVGDLLVVGSLFWAGLVLWAGGPFQYACWPLPLLAATRPRLAFAYGVATAAWLGWAYADALVARWPFQSVFFVTTPTRSNVAIALPLTALAVAIASLARREPDRPRPAVVPADAGGKMG